jgi:transcriptional regulator with XRE-family HTH domain
MHRLRQERQRLGLSLREVQAVSGVKISYLSALERNEQGNPSLDIARKLARCYGVSVDYLFPPEDQEDFVHWRGLYEQAARDLEAAHEQLEAIRRIVSDEA